MESKKNYIHELPENEYHMHLAVSVSPHYGVNSEDLVKKNALLITKERTVNPAIIVDSNTKGTVTVIIQPKTALTLDMSSAAYFSRILLVAMKRTMSMATGIDDDKITDEECLKAIQLENSRLSGFSGGIDTAIHRISEEYKSNSPIKPLIDKLIETEKKGKFCVDSIKKFSDLAGRGEMPDIDDELTEETKLISDEILALSKREDIEILDMLERKNVLFSKLALNVKAIAEIVIGLKGAEVFSKLNMTVDRIREVFKKYGPKAVQEELERLPKEERERILKELL